MNKTTKLLAIVILLSTLYSCSKNPTSNTSSVCSVLRNELFISDDIKGKVTGANFEDLKVDSIFKSKYSYYKFIHIYLSSINTSKKYEMRFWLHDSLDFNYGKYYYIDVSNSNQILTTKDSKPVLKGQFSLYHSYSLVGTDDLEICLNLISNNKIDIDMGIFKLKDLNNPNQNIFLNLSIKDVSYINR